MKEIRTDAHIDIFVDIRDNVVAIHEHLRSKRCACFTVIPLKSML